MTKNDRGPGLCCPSCAHTHHSTKDSRKGLTGVLRRRRCDSCGKAFRTIELRLTDLHITMMEAEFGFAKDRR